MIYLTGDTHYTIDLKKVVEFAKSHEHLTKYDYLIVLGDFGLIWSRSQDKAEMEIREFYRACPFTTLFLDGNHENHARLAKLTKEDRFGGKVGKVNDSIYHLLRGEVYNIDGNKILTFGGAQSIDRSARIEGLSWWPQEKPNKKELKKALDQKDKNVDYILTHTLPRSFSKRFRDKMNMHLIEDETELMLEDVRLNYKFKKWYCGHFHDDVDFGDFRVMYFDIIKLGE